MELFTQQTFCFSPPTLARDNGNNDTFADDVSPEIHVMKESILVEIGFLTSSRTKAFSKSDGMPGNM